MTALAWTLVHFIWQGALIALALAVCLRSRGITAATRYALSVATLGMMLAVPAVTFALLTRPPAVATSAPAALSQSSVDGSDAVVKEAGDGASASQSARPPRPASYAPAIVLVWAAGVLALALRLLGGWVVAVRFAPRVARPAAPDIVEMVARASARLGLRQAVKVLESAQVGVPSVIGWLRPVILLPAAALAGLPPAQLEALLAHELAHIRRRDYLVNLAQMVVETVLFYHPAVWWVSRQVRTEREHCCDDLAVTFCDRLEYVSALSTLARISTTPRFALAASDGSLLSRARRLLLQPSTERGAASAWLSAVVALVILACIPVGLVSMRSDSRDQVAVEARKIEPQEIQAPGPIVAESDETDRAERASSRQPPRESAPQATAGGAQAAPSERQGTEMAELARISAKLAAAEEQAREIDRQRRDLERQARDQQAQNELAELTARVESLQNELARRTRRVEVGTEDPTVTTEVQIQIGTTERRMRAIREDMQRNRAADQLEERRLAQNRLLEELMQKHAALRQSQGELSERRVQAEREAAALTMEARAVELHVDQLRRSNEAVRREVGVRAGAAAIAGVREADKPAELMVSLDVNGEQRAAFGPRARPYTQGGPSVAVAVPQDTGARTSDGRRISGVEVIGWQERDAVRVMVFALVPRDEKFSDFTTDDRLVARVDAGSYLLTPGQTLTLDELSAHGANGLSLRLAPARER